MNQFSKLYIFGDSFSDTGNAFQLTNGVLAGVPNWKGRFSDGPVWVERLAQGVGTDDGKTLIHSEDGFASLHNSLNFAVGGATTGHDNLFPLIMPHLPTLPGLATQVEQYLTLAQRQADANALYVLWAGPADYAPFVDGVPQQTEPTAAIANLQDAIDRLSRAGARQFLIANVPDIGQMPLAAATAAVTDPAAVSRAIAQYNQALARWVESVNSDAGIALMLFDLWSLVNAWLQEPQAYGWTNTTQAASVMADCKPTEYIFWDPVHFTARAHQLIALEAIKFLGQCTLVVS